MRAFSFVKQRTKKACVGKVKREIAKKLDISRITLYRKIEKYIAR